MPGRCEGLAATRDAGGSLNLANAVSELVWTEGTNLSGFFVNKKPPFNTLKKSTCIPKLL